jgi:hypothetical protein
MIDSAATRAVRCNLLHYRMLRDTIPGFLMLTASLLNHSQVLLWGGDDSDL